MENMNIAAASILAKTHRDEFMYNIHEKFPITIGIKTKGTRQKNTGRPSQLMALLHITGCHLN